MKSKPVFVFCLFLFLCGVDANTLLLKDHVHGKEKKVNTCELSGNNKRLLSEVIKFYNDEIGETFVGQYKATMEVRRHLSDKLYYMSRQQSGKVKGDSKAVILHLVGPSGTGKSFLAQIVAKSLFKPLECKSLTQYFGKTVFNNAAWSVGTSAAMYVDALSNPVSAMAAAVGGAALDYVGTMGVEKLVNHYGCSDVDSWLQTCGIIYASFSEESDAHNAKKLRNTLNDLAEELKFEQNPVLVLDDFNFCRGVCQNTLKQMLTENTLIVPSSSKKVDTRNVIVLLTSDLTNFGVQLRKGENYDDALGKVEDAAKRYWGKSSFVVTSAHMIPFAPLSEPEIVKVLDMMLRKFSKDISLHMEMVLGNLKADREEDVFFQWDGRFRCSHKTKQKILDHMHDSIEKKNSRAIVEELSTMLRQIINYPESLQERLSKFSAQVSYITHPTKVNGFALPNEVDYFQKAQKTYVYNQDIILKFDASKRSKRFVKLVITEGRSGSSLNKTVF